MPLNVRNVLAQQTFVFQYGCADRFTGGAGGKDEPTGSGGGDESNHSNPERRRVSETVCYGAGNERADADEQVDKGTQHTDRRSALIAGDFSQNRCGDGGPWKREAEPQKRRSPTLVEDQRRAC